MDFNELNRKLQGRCDPVVAAVIAEIYLMLTDLSKQQSVTSTVMIDIVNTMGEVVALHKQTQDNVAKLAGWGKRDDITFHSEIIDGS